MDFKNQQVNGFSVGVVELPYLESASIGVFIPVGSRHENEFPNGIAHFFEHMIFKGTSNLSAHELARTIEGEGCTSNAYTSEDHTVLELIGPSDQLELMLKTCSEMIWDSAFLPEDIASEASVIEEEILGYLENPSDHIFELASEAIWGDSPLGKPITGTAESIQQITQQDLKKFQTKHYTSKGIAIAVAGNVKSEDVYQQVQSYFPELNDNARASVNAVTPMTGNIIHLSEIEQCHLCLNFPTFDNKSEHRAALQLLSIILGETMSSRLFQTIREQLGLCYSIDSDYTLFEDTGVFSVYAAIDHSRQDEAEAKILEVIANITASPPNQEEFAAAQRYAIAQRRIGLEGSEAHMERAGSSLMRYGNIRPPSEGITKLASVTLDDVIKVAEIILNPEKIARAVILPKA